MPERVLELLPAERLVPYDAVLPVLRAAVVPEEVRVVAAPEAVRVLPVLRESMLRESALREPAVRDTAVFVLP